MQRGWKKAILDECRRILKSVPAGERIENAEDAKYLLSVLSRHPESEQKIGVGVLYFFTRRTQFKNVGFWLRRTDLSETDFSFYSCVTPKDWRKDFAAACRHAVSGQVIAFKQKQFGDRAFVPCEITGEPLSWPACHVDHAPPFTFEKIVETFLNGRDLSASIKPTADGEILTTFLDSTIETQFQAFHESLAKLRIVSKHENLSTLRKAKP